MQRVSVVGNSGSGKSAVGARVAARLGVPYVELDALFHQPDWGELPADEFRQEVARVIEGEGWVVDGNYSTVRDLVWQRADTVVWLDLPRRVVMRRVVCRSLDRVIFRRALWNGNRERWRALASRDPTKSIIAWAWTRHGVYRDRYTAAASDPAWAHVHFTRLRSPKEVAAFLASTGPQAAL
jgi:adenylate kinase family enzyme